MTRPYLPPDFVDSTDMAWGVIAGSFGIMIVLLAAGIGGQPVFTAPPEPRARQAGADPVCLPDRIDPDDCQIPMRLRARVGTDGRGPRALSPAPSDARRPLPITTRPGPV